MTTLRHSNITGTIIGAVLDVFHELGYGFSEKVYSRALAIRLREASLDVVEQPIITVRFHGHTIGTFWCDLAVERKVLVEVKAKRELEPHDEAQILNYLKAAGGGVGLLVNFGPDVKHRRFVMGDMAADLPNLTTPAAR